MTEVLVDMASVLKLMDSANTHRLEIMINAWLEKIFLLNDPPIKHISTIITSQHLESDSSRSIPSRSLQKASGLNIQLGMDISGFFVPTPTALSAADLHFEERVAKTFQDHRLTAILLGMIQDYTFNDPSYTYFSDVFMIQTSVSMPSSNASSSSSLVGLMKIIVGSVSGGVGLILFSVLLLLWRDRYVLPRDICVFFRFYDSAVQIPSLSPLQT